MKFSRLLLVLLLFQFAAGCNRADPVKIGFVAGLTGKVADLGVGGRNGVQLALEEANAKGGAAGRQLELVVKDCEQNPELARKAVEELIREGVEVIIGPMTSSMAMAMVPRINSSKTILLSPTVTTTELTGKDDNFLRVISSTDDYSSKSARYQYQKLGVRTVAVIYDVSNRSYTGSWLSGFRRTFEGLGGRVVLEKPFSSAKDTVFRPLVADLLAAKADAVLIICNSVDSALICQQLRNAAPSTRVVMAEWSSTERFVELAGEASEGVVVAQFLNRNDSSRRYLDFLKTFRERFRQEPGYPGVAGYDAASVLVKALATRRKGQPIKDAIVSIGRFDCLQQELKIDRFGDADRRTYVTLVRNGRYVTME